LASPQVGVDYPVGVGLVGQHAAGSGGWSARASGRMRMPAITASKARQSWR
jgi:hypothetical protein